MSFCPHCGYSLDRDEIVERDGFRLDPRGTVSFQGRAVRATTMQALILHSLASASGRWVKPHVLADRIGSEAEHPDNVIAVLLSRTRHSMAETGAPDPVRNEHGKGYRWEPTRCL